MNSVQDLPKEGLPHSDIRGSTIARISPRLIAACHVLHRLLVPRHPLNALLILNPSPPARRTKPHPSAQTLPACPIGQRCNTETLTPDREVSPARHSISPNQIHHFKQHGSPQRPRPQERGFPEASTQARHRRHPCGILSLLHGGDRIRTDDPLLAKQALSR